MELKLLKKCKKQLSYDCTVRVCFLVPWLRATRKSSTSQA